MYNPLKKYKEWQIMLSWYLVLVILYCDLQLKLVTLDIMFSVDPTLNTSPMDIFA